MIRQYSYANDGQKYLSPHFQAGEFRSYDDELGYLTTDVILIDDNLIPILENLYQTLNCSSIIITSGYRSEDFDIRIGGFAGYHSKGQAVDIICYNQDNQIIPSTNVCITAQNLGVLGIGYGGTYTHIDTRDWKSFFDETNNAVNINDWYDYFGIPRPVTNYLNYQAHVQDYGWLDAVHSGQTCGTTGQTKRLEAIKIDSNLDIKVKAHIQDIGWVDYGMINKDTIIGTTGESKGIEALCFEGNFEYRVHIQNFGWSVWTKADGVITQGSVGLSTSLEAIEIRLI